MRLLLDTHVVLWALGDPDRLAPVARAAIADATVELAVSTATVWELAIKVGLGKLRLPGSVAQWFVPAVVELGAQWLEVTAIEAAAVETLPTHHRDPFDRLLIVQALAGGWTLVTADAAFAGYGVPVLHT